MLSFPYILAVTKACFLTGLEKSQVFTLKAKLKAFQFSAVEKLYNLGRKKHRPGRCLYKCTVFLLENYYIL